MEIFNVIIFISFIIIIFICSTFLTKFIENHLKHIKANLVATLGNILCTNLKVSKVLFYFSCPEDLTIQPQEGNFKTKRDAPGSYINGREKLSLTENQVPGYVLNALVALSLSNLIL